MEKEKADALRVLLVAAIQNALVGVRESYAAVHFDSPNPLASVMTTLARLKLIEVTVLQTAIGSLGVEAKDMPLILDDISKSVLLQMVASGAVTPSDAKAIYPSYGIDDALTKAALGPAAYPSNIEAHKTLLESLEKIKALREE